MMLFCNLFIEWLSYKVFQKTAQSLRHHILQRYVTDTGPYHVSNFFPNIQLKTTWLCDIQMQHFSAIDFVPFFWNTL